MKKIMLIVLLAVSTQASAGDRHGRHHERHHPAPVYYGPTYYTPSYYAPGYYGPVYPAPIVINDNHMDTADILMPMLIGGVIGYALADQKDSDKPTTSSVSKSEPLYQYKTIHDADCNCDRRVLVKVE